MWNHYVLIFGKNDAWDIENKFYLNGIYQRGWDLEETGLIRADDYNITIGDFDGMM